MQRDYNIDMAIGLFLMHFLEGMFFLGLAGSSVVVVYSFVEDTVELFAKQETTSMAPPGSETT